MREPNRDDAWMERAARSGAGWEPFFWGGLSPEGRRRVRHSDLAA